jgi:cell fate regulator YaaT (PSP1 superfamily)
LPEFVEVQFKGNRREYFTWEHENPPDVGDAVIVAVERGQDFGRVSAVGAVAERKCGVGCDGCALAKPKEPPGAILRAASQDDTHLIEELRKKEEDVRRKVMERVKAHGLPMKISDAEWQWDRKKLTIYFTADRRVDFRALVRDLASLFRTRIELRQIGARDEAKRLDGVGRCGRQYCCSSWLPELRPVSLSLAKDQRLSLNPSQISGGCGRLLCCLRYEHDFYVSSRKRFPKEGKTLRTPRGDERVEAVDIFRERILLRTEDGSTRTVVLVELKREVKAIEPAPPAETPPSALAAFDETASPTTTAEFAAAVSPEPKRRRRRRRRSRKRRRDSTSSEEGGRDE